MLWFGRRGDESFSAESPQSLPAPLFSRKLFPHVTLDPDPHCGYGVVEAREIGCFNGAGLGFRQFHKAYQNWFVGLLLGNGQSKKKVID